MDQHLPPLVMDHFSLPAGTDHLSSPPLTFWKDITPDPHPLKYPDLHAPHVLIIGGGISGLATAWVLLDHGYKVTLLAKEWANSSAKDRLTAQIAGALWEYPPAVCGSHTDETSLAYSKHWCMTAYHIWNAIASTPSIPSGARAKPACFFFPYAIEESPKQLRKMNEIMASGVRGFVHSPELIDSLAHDTHINPAYGAKDAYQHLSIIVDTDQAMHWLMDLVKAKGASFVKETVDKDLLLAEYALRDRFSADAIVNCAGLASRTLANDPTCYPLRGALLRLVNDGRDFPKIDAALSISADASADNGIVFLVPRNDDILILGGIAQRDEETLDLTIDDPVIRRMRERCEHFVPSLKNARLDPEYPFAQGLRPAREGNCRVERELRPRASVDDARGGARPRPSRIVHNYGHGGSGWSLSFGCAAEVLRLVEEALTDVPPKSMAAVKKASKL